MTSRKPSSRWALWAFVAVLLLKAAMPLLASASAQAQGKTLVEVCTAYGVSLKPVDGQEHSPVPGHSPAYGSEHCALNALAAVAAIDAPALTPAVAPHRESVSSSTHTPSQAPDTCAAWVARLKHGPPVFS